MLCDGTYCLLGNQSPAERERILRERIDEAIRTEFRLDAALHLIARVSLESIKKDVFHHLATPLYRKELSSFISGKEVRSEVQVNNVYGFGGIVDLVVDNRPVEVKTSWNVRPEHRCNSWCTSLHRTSIREIALDISCTRNPLGLMSRMKIPAIYTR